MEHKYLAALAFDHLSSELVGSQIRPLSKLGYSGNGLPAKAPLFVTWTKRGQLRGCIGTFTAKKLESGVGQYAKIAAFRDHRFAPISKKELPELEVCVTLLGDQEPIADKFDWEIGVHGLRAEFPGGYDSTYLPEVAEEQGWTKEETIESLADKAGAPSSRGVKLWRYGGYKSRLTYQEYRESYPLES